MLSIFVKNIDNISQKNLEAFTIRLKQIYKKLSFYNHRGVLQGQSRKW